MPRKARKDIVSNFIHVMIQGINKEYIFNDNTEIKTYLKYLKESIDDANVKIIAYCMMNNHAHFIYHFDDVKKLSNVMSHTNTKYAMFYNRKNNRCGIVFRNRYRSEEILNQKYLRSCIRYIHNNPVKAGMCERAGRYKHSSYNDYKHQKSNMLDWKFVEECLKRVNINLESIIDETEEDEAIAFAEINDPSKKGLLKKNILKKYMKEHRIRNIDEIRYNKLILEKTIFFLFDICKMNKQEVASLLGINRSKICRIIKEYKQKV